MTARITKKRLLGAFVVLVIVGLAGYAAFNQYMLQNTQKELSNLKKSTQSSREVQNLIVEVGKVVELPKESPTVATVTDVEKLRKQQFFSRAQNGDKVLIFTGAKKAILYRPTTKKIVDVAPINLGTQSAKTAPQTSATPQPTIQQAQLPQYNIGTQAAGVSTSQ